MAEAPDRDGIRANALLLSEQRFRLLVESVEDYAIFMLDPAGNVASWNAGAERIKGYTSDEIVGRHFSVFYPDEPGRDDRTENELTIAAKEGRFEEEGWRIRKNGSRFWASVVLTALRDETGSLVGFAKVTRDLTERRRAEDERVQLARETAARIAAEDARTGLATTLHSIGDGVITTDEIGRVVMLNPVAEQLTGWTEEDAKGQPLRRVFAILNEGTRREVESPVERVLREGVVVGLANHTVLLHRSGGETPIADSGAPIRNAEGHIRGVVLVFRDASAERRAEAHRTFLVEVTRALASSLDYRETLAKIARSAVPQFADWCSVDIVDEGTSTPKQVVVMHENPKKVELAHQWATRYPPDPNAPRGAPNVIRTGRSEFYPEISEEMLVQGALDEEHLRLMKELQLRSAIVVPITDGSRTHGAMTLVYGESGRRYTPEDVHLLEEVGRRAGVAVENARLYRTAQHARLAADEANRMKDEFLATVSHELRTPLNAILGWARLLTASALDETQRVRATASIERNAVAMAQLVEDLLDVSRIISGKMRLDVAYVELGGIIEAAIESMRPALEAKEIELERAFPREGGAVYGDAARLQQIVWNLLSNAVKFTPRGGRVAVFLRRKGAAMELEVTDTGKGIAPDFLPLVFDPFRQQDGSISRATGGLGLGLAITKRLVELHGGDIQAASSGDGRGATFTVRIPVAAASSLARTGSRSSITTETSPVPEPAAELAGLHVLVVDDEEDARHLLEVILAGQGAIVTTASSAAEAIALFDQRVPDILLSDIAMPVESGFDLVRRVRARPADKGGQVPAAALTAYARAEDRRKMLAAGFTMHVPKPVDPPELVAVVAALARFAAPR